VTLVELLVVISIVALLMAMLLPAVNSARESGRQTACQNHLRQFGIVMTSHAVHRHTFCTGAFDWRLDGCVTEVGWVADLVQRGAPVGKMLCPSNPARIAQTFNDLLAMVWNLDTCTVDRRGSPVQIAFDGSRRVNPCRFLAEGDVAGGVPAPTGEDRRKYVEAEIFQAQYNTNYTASWFLVRGGVVLDANGNLTHRVASCVPSPLAVGSTAGPLSTAVLDSSVSPSSMVPLLGCGAAVDTLQQPIGSVEAGTPAVQPFTRGPVKTTTMNAPGIPGDLFPVPTPRTVWGPVWTATLQDYRGFAPVHKNTCNLLFADGSVRAIADLNKDGQLNNGFPADPANGFADDTVELTPEEAVSRWSLRIR
jgi:prepilin-type processing-associated H-X9-DG protein